eukprot:289915-Prymnesium_polylepis.1
MARDHPHMARDHPLIGHVATLKWHLLEELHVGHDDLLADVLQHLLGRAGVAAASGLRKGWDGQGKGNAAPTRRADGGPKYAQASKQSSNHAIKQSPARTRRADGGPKYAQAYKQAIMQSSNHAIKQSFDQAITCSDEKS